MLEEIKEKSSWNKGLQKAIESNKGRKHSKQWKENQSKGLKRYKRTKEHQRKITEARTGLKLSDITRKKMSIARKESKNPNWQGGKSFQPYSSKFNKKLKEKIKERDHYICQLCGKTESEAIIIDTLKRGLTIHHIDYDKKNCKEINLITLCRKCNSIVNFNRHYWTIFFKKKLKN